MGKGKRENNRKDNLLTNLNFNFYKAIVLPITSKFTWIKFNISSSSKLNFCFIYFHRNLFKKMPF